MEHEQYSHAGKSIADFVDKGDYAAALAVVRSLIESDRPDLDKSITCSNGAVVCEKMGDAAAALAWYDAGIALESPHSRCFVAEEKAAYLFSKGRKAEAIAIYDELLTEPFLTTYDVARIRGNRAAMMAAA